MYSLLKQTWMVASFGAAGALLVGAVRGLPEPPSAADDVQACAAPDELLRTPPKIAVDDAGALAARGEVTFVDCRSLAEYQEGHIAGAISLPAEHLQLTESTRRLLTGSSTVVAYCDAACSRSTKVALRIMDAGVADVRILEGGIDAWIAGGYPAESGAAAGAAAMLAAPQAASATPPGQARGDKP